MANGASSLGVRAEREGFVNATWWLAAEPPTPEARAAHTKVLRELGAIIAGQRPDEVHFVIRRSKDPTPRKLAEEIRGT